MTNEKVEDKINKKQYQQEIEKYFGSMRGKIGSREDINNDIIKDRTPRPERDSIWMIRNN